MAKAQQNKRLTLAELAKRDKEMSQQKEVLLLGKYKEKIDLHFRNHKLDLLAASYLDILRQLNQREDVEVETLYHSTILLNTLIIKYFSTVQLPEIRDLDSLVQVSTVLVDLGIMQELFGDGESAFPADQIQKLTEHLDKSAKAIGERFGELAVNSALKEVDDNAESIQQSE